MAQREFCVQQQIEYVPASSDSKVGYAATTEGLLPLNGLRHPAVGDTSGWYVWCGVELSEASDFFVPVHLHHVSGKYPEIVKLLGLPPGYRFLLAGNYLDVWFDASLLSV